MKASELKDFSSRIRLENIGILATDNLPTWICNLFNNV